MSLFKKAVREAAFLRIALMGPAGSGKTYSALLLAKHLGAKRIAVIDSERGSAKLYSDLVDFEVCELESFAAERYIEAIQGAEREGFDTLIVDSLSHAWAGKDGILEYKDKRTDQSRSKDSFGAGWRDATPLHNKLVDTILAFKGNVICTLRTKTEYVIEEDARGKKVPRKLGMAPVQRDGVEYEFTVVGDFVEANKLAITKTRCSALNDAVILKPGREMAETLLAWIKSGAPQSAPAAEAPAPAPAAKPEPAKPSAVDDALAKVAAAFPGRAEEARRMIAALKSEADQLGALRAAYARFAEEANTARTARLRPLLDRIDKLRRAIAADHPGAREASVETVNAYLNGKASIDSISEPDLASLAGELEGIYNGATEAAAHTASGSDASANHGVAA